MVRVLLREGGGGIVKNKTVRLFVIKKILIKKLKFSNFLTTQKLICLNF